MPTANEILTDVIPNWAPKWAGTVSEWADRYRMLPSSSAEPGRWRTARAPYLREIMDAVLDPDVREVWWQKSAQVGATEALNNLCGYFIDVDPGPILVLQPTVEMGQSWSKDRFQPMLRDSPTLQAKVTENKSRDSGNTIMHKNFAGGTLDIAGANSPAGLASRPKRIILCDEVDRYPASAGAEGDPVALAQKRSTTYWNRIFFACSTPTIKGASRIEAGFENGDQRHYFVPCPHCGHEQLLEWERLDYSEAGTKEEPVIVCQCGEHIKDSHKPKMLAKGKWLATAEGAVGIRSYYINELYSPWSTWAKVVADFIAAKKRGAESIKTWKNTSLGQTYEEIGQAFDATIIAGRAEEMVNWTERIPDKVMVVTAGVDVQRDRIEIEVVGWGLGEESWSLDYKVMKGDPKQADIWERLDQYLAKRYPINERISLPVVTACVDSGDGFTAEEVYFACMRRNRGRIGWIPIKGSNQFDAPIFQQPTRAPRPGQTRPWLIGVSRIKRIVYDYLNKQEEGPGFMHFPEGRPDSYYKGLTAEKLVTVRTKGFPRLEWHKRHDRNEPLDCRTYAYAAMRILNPDWEVIAQKREESAENAPKLANNSPKSVNRLRIRAKGFDNRR